MRGLTQRKISFLDADAKEDKKFFVKSLILLANNFKMNLGASTKMRVSEIQSVTSNKEKIEAVILEREKLCAEMVPQMMEKCRQEEEPIKAMKDCYKKLIQKIKTIEDDRRVWISKAEKSKQELNKTRARLRNIERVCNQKRYKMKNIEQSLFENFDKFEEKANETIKKFRKTFDEYSEHNNEKHLAELQAEQKTLLEKEAQLKADNTLFKKYKIKPVKDLNEPLQFLPDSELSMYQEMNEKIRKVLVPLPDHKTLESDISHLLKLIQDVKGDIDKSF